MKLQKMLRSKSLTFLSRDNTVVGSWEVSFDILTNGGPALGDALLLDGIMGPLSGDCLRNELGKKARQRVQDLFSIDRVSKNYLDLYQGKAV